MKSLRWITCLAGAWIALGLTLSLAQPTTPEVPIAPAAPATPEAAPAGALRELGVAPASEPEPVETETVTVRRERSRANLVVFGSNALLGAGERASEVVAIIGDTVVDGEVDGEVVAILGDSTLNGESRQVVAVLGNVTVNGHVRGDVVAVMGGVQLGPRAVVDGEVVSIGGGIERAPGSTVQRGVQEIAFMKGHLPRMDGLRAWFKHCLLLGRPLGFGENLGWAWGVAASFLVFYLLLALAFGRGVEKCAETLEQRPGFTILASFLTILMMPILAVLLAITGIGPVILFFAGVIGTLFGKAAFITWLGRRITKPLGIKLPVAAALIGGVILTIIYVVPYLGIVVWKVSGFLGLGMVVYTLILGMKREKPAVPPRVPMPGAPTGTPSMAFTPVAESPSASVPVAIESPPAFSPPFQAAPQFSTLPRAGFWIRIAASALDAILVGIVAGNIDFIADYFLAAYATYCIAFWALKATTIGGVICGLKVVRLDDRPIDWTLALIRALGGFLSFVVAGVGFIWVAFDPDKQSWHDKIAGTTVVRVPRGTPLI